MITGFRDKEFQKNLEALGAKFGTSVSKKTFAVIVIHWMMIQVKQIKLEV